MFPIISVKEAFVNSWGAWYHVVGVFDAQERFYNRALSQAEIQALVATSLPGVDFSAAPLTETVPLAVTFTNATSGAATYLWDFGDEVTSTLVSPVHPYTQAGVYTVSLTADGPGGSDTLTWTNYITVSNGIVYTTTHRVISYTYP